ncbi:MAG: MFS transporter [Phycisphaerales bacterium]|nr:MAG: MFS transporter [Phycisphaerales bacterium]
MSEEQKDEGIGNFPAEEKQDNFIVKYFKDFRILKETKREYWGLQVINMLDCLAYFAMFNIAVVTLSDDFGFTDAWAGYIYTIFSGLTTIFLFFSGVVTDWLGIKRALYIAMTGLLLTRCGVVLVQYMDEPVRMDRNTQLSILYDGDGISFVQGHPDLRITARDNTMFEVDLYGAQTIGDVLDRINDAPGNDGRIEAGIAPGWTSLRLEDKFKERNKAAYKRGLANRIVVESANDDSEAADKLGLASEGELSAMLEGGRIITDLNAALVSDLNQGDGLEDGTTLTIRDRWGTSFTVDGLDQFATLREIIDRVQEEAETAGVRIAIDFNSPGTGLRINDKNGRLSVSPETVLSDLHGGEGAPISEDPAKPDLKFVARDGTEYEVSLTGCLTLGDVIGRVSEATNGHIELALIHGQKFTVTDIRIPADESVELGRLKVLGIDESGVQVARRLGILKERGVKRITFDGSAISNPRWVSGAVTLGDLIDRINNAGGNYEKIAATLDGQGRIVLQDQTERKSAFWAFFKNLFRGGEKLSVEDAGELTVATALGLAGSDDEGSIVGTSLGEVGLDTPLSQLNGGQGLALNDDGPEFTINARDDTEIGIELGNRTPDHVLGVEGDAAVPLGFDDEANESSYSAENITENKVRSYLTIGLLACMAPFMAMLITVFQAGNRRFTSKRSRGAGFNLWYLFMNVGAAGGGFLIDIIYLSLDLPRFHVFTFGIFTGILCLIAITLLIKNTDQLRAPGEKPEDNEKQSSDESGEIEEIEPTLGETEDKGKPEKKGMGPWEITKAVVSEPIFWRFTVLISLLLGVRAVFLYLGLLFPKFWYRVIGEDAQVGLMQAFNPVLVIIGLILVIPILQKFNVYKMLVFGAFITSVSMFIPAVGPLGGMGIVEWTYATTIIFLFILTVGELIWSPRLSEYTAAIAPEGQEGTYLGLSMVPYFLAKLVVSALSGNMLQRWCPEYPPGEPNVGERIQAGEMAFWDTPYVMWVILGAVAIGGTIIAILGKGWFTKGAHFDVAEGKKA